MGDSATIYTGLFLTEEGLECLNSFLQELQVELLPCEVPDLHVTLKFRPSEEELQSNFQERGKEVTLRTLGWASHPKLQALHVEILDEDLSGLCDNQFAHITVRTDGVTPAHYSNGLLEFSNFEKTHAVELSAVLGDYVSGDGVVLSPRGLQGIRRRKRRNKRPKPKAVKPASNVELDPSWDSASGQAGKLYRNIRNALEKSDNIDELRSLLPNKMMHGEDFEVWPKQSLLLHFCTKKGYVECVQYLVGELGFNVDFQRPKDLCTCLHVAAYYDNQPMIKTLIDLGADPLMSNKWGEIPKLAQDAGRKGLT